MLHLINPPEGEVEENLFALVDYQRQLLAFAATSVACDLATLQASVRPDLTRWVTGKRNLYTALIDLVACDVAEKAQVLQDFIHDQDFWITSDPNNFQFAFASSATPAHQHAATCLKEFFQNLHASGAIVPHPSKARKEQIVEGYLETNPDLLGACPCCQGTWAEQASHGASSYTLEHIFHKEQYPTLSVHPYNLLPICNVCNQRRGNRDALRTPRGAQLTVGRAFHPFFRPVLEYVELECRSSGLRPEQLRFRNLPTHLEDWSEAVDTYAHLYEIPRRWEQRWYEIDALASLLIRTGIEARQHQTQPLTQEDFEQVVRMVIGRFRREHGRYHYPAQRWLEWALQYRLPMMYEAHVVQRGLNAIPVP